MQQSAERQRRSGLVLIATIAVLAMVATACTGGGDETTTGTGTTGGVESFTHAHGLQVAAWAPESVFLATHHGLIRIDEEGRRWQVVSEQPHDFMGFSVHPEREGVMYSSGHPAPGSDLGNPIGFMVSEDAGRTWTQRSLQGKVDFHAMAVQAGNGDVVYGFDVTSGPALYRTSDAGENWQRIESDAIEQANVIALAVHPKDADHVLAATDQGLLRSTDAGRSWESLVDDAPVSAVVWDPQGGDRIVAYIVDPARGLVESDDAGATWSQVPLEVAEGDAVAHVALHPREQDEMYVVTFDHQLLRTTDGGESFDTLARDGKPVS